MSEYTACVSLHTDEHGVIETLELKRLCDQISNEEKYD